MRNGITRVGSAVLCLAGASAVYSLTATAQEPKDRADKPKDDPAAILGAWDVQDRHLAMGSVFQPTHGTRQRESKVYLQRQGDRLTGYSVTPNHAEIRGQEGWKDGRTDFRAVTFADGKLVIEIDVREVAHGWGRAAKDKATMRVEAKLTGGRLVGHWRMFLPDGSEPFRGEWEAVRGKDSAKK